MKHVLICLLALLILPAYGQTSNTIQGKVVNGETGAIISNASVFITNSSKGTVSSSTGNFELNNVPAGTYDLVVSCIGFETQVYTYSANQLPLRLQIQLKPKVDELQTVVVEPFEKDGWANWGQFFIESFIGTSAEAKDCTIKNYEVLHFRNSKKKNQLSVVADEPMIIENKALGYSIKYQLEQFTFNFNEHTLFYFGYTLFDDLNKKGPKEWQIKNREKAYNGSIQHFMASLYNNRLQEEGFEVKRLVKTPNLEKQRVRQLYREHGAAINSKDSSTYYERILKQPDMFEKYGQSFLTADSLVSKKDEMTKQLFFTDYLYITYKNEKEDREYLQYTHESRPVFYERSVLWLLNFRAVFIGETGNYYMPNDLMSYGYWGWSEKTASLLPLDYEPAKK